MKLPKSVTCKGYRGRPCETETRRPSGVCQICTRELRELEKETKEKL